MHERLLVVSLAVVGAIKDIARTCLSMTVLARVGLAVLLALLLIPASPVSVQQTIIQPVSALFYGIQGPVVRSDVAERPPPRLPVLRGASAYQAYHDLRNLGVAVQLTQASSDAVPPGAVLSQDPEPGRVVSPGETVRLVVANRSRPTSLPSLVGQTPESASSILSETRIALQVRGSAYDSRVPPGQIRAQQPGPGSLLPPDATVAVWISKGPPAMVAVPSLLGMSLGDAQQAARLSGFTLNLAGPAGVGNFVVVRQFPDAGSQEMADKLRIVVQTAPIQVEVPSENTDENSQEP